MSKNDKISDFDLESTLFQGEKEQKPEGQINEGTLFTVAFDDEKDSAFQKPEIAEWQTNDILDNLYRVENVLGEGGMGKVYKIYHLNWSVYLAVKIIKPSKLSFAMLQVFRKEAETWINLAKHPHIATAFYVKEVMDVPAIFVEYVDGGSLNDWLKAGKLKNIEEKLKIAIQFCEGMVYAHSKGLVHRDIKPDNVLMELDGTVKITDFGLAKSLESDDPDAHETAGTPPYMPPEQWANTTLAKFPADIYAFGVMLYEIVCGVRPFVMDEEDTRPSTIAYRLMHISDVPKEPIEITKELPEGLSKLIMKCLEKEPQNRPESFTEISDLLNEIYNLVTGLKYKSIDFDSDKIKADDLNNRALSFLDLGQVDKAKKIWEESLNIEEYHYATNINLALFNWDKSLASEQETIIMMNRGVENRHLDPNVYYFNAIFNLKMREFEDGLKNIETAIEKGLNSAKALNLKGLCLFGLKKYQEAKKCFEDAISQEALNYGYQYNLIATLYQLGSIDKAKEKHEELVKVTKRKEIESCLKKPEDFWDVELPKTNLRNFAHNEKVTALAINANGTIVVSGSEDSTLKIWNLNNEKSTEVLIGHKAAIASVAMSLDGSTLISGSRDGELKVWDLKTKNCFLTIKEHSDYIYKVGISPDGKYAISSSGDKTVKCWDLVTGNCINTLEQNHWYVMVAINNDGTRAIISYTISREIKLWGISKGALLKTFSGHDSEVKSLDVSFSANRLISASNGAMKLWDLQTGKCIKTLKGHVGSIDSVKISADGTKAVSFSGALKYWDLQSGKCYKSIEWNTHGVRDYDVLTINADATRIITPAGWNKTIKLWKVVSIKDLVYPIYFNENEYLISRVTSVGEDIKLKQKFEVLYSKAQECFENKLFEKSYNILKEAKSIVGVKEDLRINELFIKLFKKAKYDDINNIYFERTLKGHTGSVSSVAIDTEGTKIISGSLDKAMKLWDLFTGDCIQTFTGHTDVVNSVAIKREGDFAISASKDKSIKFWDLGTGKCIRSFKGHSQGVNSVIFNSDESKIISGSNDNSIKIWHVDTGVCLMTLEGHAEAVNSVDIDHNSRILISGSNDKTLRVWDFSTGNCLNTLKDIERRIYSYRADSDMAADFQVEVYSVSISADGKTAISGSDQNTARVWDLEKGKCTKVLKSYASSILLSPDATKAFFAQGGISVVNIENEKDISYANCKSGKITTLALGAENKKMVGGNENNTIQVFDIDWKLEFPPNINMEENSDDLTLFDNRRIIDRSFLKKEETKQIISTVNSDKLIENEVDKALNASNNTSETTAQFKQGTLFTIAFNDDLKNTEKTPKTTTWQSNDILDNLYKVDKVLGEGGMGKVYKVFHLNWNTSLAVKVIRQDKFSSEMLQVFKQEAETWINLAKHPHIATAFYVREVMSIPAIFVEYVEAGSLKDWLKQGKFNNIEDKIKIAIQFCEGMVYAHSKGLVHRDIKPDNVLMEADGTVKITDFGLAKSIESIEFEEGSMAGTPPYMPPEQWSSAYQAKAPADVYAFGILLYELLCGIRPFELSEEDSRPPTIAYRLMHLMDKPKAPKEVNIDIPDSLNILILKCLEKEPHNRYQSFNELKVLLTEIFEDITGGAYQSIEYDLDSSKAADLNNRALSFLDLGQNKVAENLWKQALVVEPTNYAVNLNLALFYRNNDLFSEQISDDLVRKAVGYDKREPYGYFIRALLDIKKRDFKEGLKSINLAIEKNINTSEAYNVKGLCLMALNELNEAKEYFDKALKISPENYGLLSNIAAVFHRQGNSEQVKKYRDLLKNTPLQEYIEKHRIPDDYILDVIIEKDISKKAVRLDSIAISKDGTLIAGGSHDDLFIWGASGKYSRQNLSKYKSNGKSLAFNGNNTKLISGTRDNNILLWDLKTKKCIKTIKGHKDSVNSVAINAAGTLALSGSSDNTLKLWNLESGGCLKTLTGHNYPIESLSVNEEFTIAVSASSYYDNKIGVWDLKTGNPLFIIEDHLSNGNSVAINSSGTLAVSGGQDKTLKLWDLSNGQCIKTLKGHKDIINSVAINSEGTKAISVSIDSTVKIWDLNSGVCIKSLIGYTSHNAQIAISSNGKRVVFGNNNKALKLWEIIYAKDFEHGIYINKESYILSKVRSVKEDINYQLKFDNLLKTAQQFFINEEYSKSYKVLCEAQEIEGFNDDENLNNLLDKLYKKAKVKKFDKAYFVKELVGHSKTVLSVAVCENGSKIVSAGTDKVVKFWDLNSDKSEKNLEGHNGRINSVAISSDGTKAISSGKDRTIKIWDLQQFKCINTLKKHKGEVTSIAMDADGEYAISGDVSSVVNIWNLKKGKCLKSIKKHKKGIDSVAITYDGTTAISGGGDQIIRVWDLEQAKQKQNKFWNSGICQKIEPIEHGYVYTVSISTDGTKAISLNDDRRTTVFNPQTGKKIKSFWGYEYYFKTVVISPDGNFAITGNMDRNVKIVDLKTEDNMQVLSGHKGNVECIAISANSRVLVSAGTDKTIRVWQIDWHLEF